VPALTQDDIVELANNYDCSDIPGGQRWVFINALELEQFARAVIKRSAAPAPAPPMEDPDCHYSAPEGEVCNKCGRIHGIAASPKVPRPDYPEVYDPRFSP
jgi:hypothetical protein